MKPKAKIMKALRKSRKEAGLVKLELYVKPEHREAIKKHAQRMKYV